MSNFLHFIHPQNIWQWVIFILFCVGVSVGLHLLAVRVGLYDAIRRRLASSRRSNSKTARADVKVRLLIVFQFMIATIAVAGVWMELENTSDQLAMVETIRVLKEDIDQNRSSVSTRLEALETENADIKETITSLENHPAIEKLDDSFVGTLERMGILAELTDHDRDGVVDAWDSWPTVPRGELILIPNADPPAAWSNGVPTLDTDGDTIMDAVDRCLNVAGADYRLSDTGGILMADTLIDQVEIPFYGCPNRDDDWIPDAVDLCPDKKAGTDEDLDGCPDEEQDLRQAGDHTWLTSAPTYGDQAGKLVGYFQGVRSPGGIHVEFMIACEAMGADGVQLAGDTKDSGTRDYTLVKSWGVCRPAAGP